jgi:hypothetical protein
MSTLKVFVATGVVALCSFVIAAPALAAPGVGWEVSTGTYPTNLEPGGSGLVYIHPLDIGAANSNGTVTVTDILPEGLTATGAGGQGGQLTTISNAWDCKGTTVVTCTIESPLAGGGGIPNGAGGSTTGILIAVKVAQGTSGTLLNRVTVAGGGALASAAVTGHITVSSQPVPFGVANFDAWFSNEDGSIDTQAGSHPYAATFDVQFNLKESPGGILPAGSDTRNVAVELPPGLVGDPTVVPRCPRDLFDPGSTGVVGCPADTQIGVSAAGYGGCCLDQEPVFNLVPPPGVAASFGFTFVGNPVFLDSSPRTGGDYGITTRTANVPFFRGARGATVTLWGVPGDHSHDRWRCNGCGSSGEVGAKPLLTLPTACEGPQEFRVHMNEWLDPAVTARASFFSHDANGERAGFTGCERLAFAPTISIAPDTGRSDTPTGLTVEVKPPVGGLSDPAGFSAADIQNTTVTLPQGLVINPGQAAGLQACQSGQNGLGTEDAPSCPNASKVGTDEIETPLLPHSLKGNVYVLQSNPPEVKLLVAASGEGVNVKLVGVVHLDEQTGQLTTTFQGTPELPFTNFRLSFSGGAQAALDTPTQCGTYGAGQGFFADFAPWSSPFVGDAFPTADFSLTEGPGGGACPSWVGGPPLPFAPSLTAGSTTDQAGAFTNFSLLLQRGDAQQRIERVQFKEPAGLAGLISSVPLCPEPQASKGECPESSKIGHAAVASGPGPYPLAIPQPGNPESPIYLTGPYGGAPFGLSILTHVIAGPFNLGKIVTRAKIEIDPHTAQITVTTDPLPQIVAGVPTDLRLINSVIDRPNFLFNPTNCSSQEFTGTAWGAPPPGTLPGGTQSSGPGSSAAISSHFGVGSCRELAFTPKISVTTAAKSSKANGASLLFKIAYPTGAMGSQSWFNEAKFDLPKQLPARLTTIQKACLASVFEANPAGCPSASVIGHAVVHTQVLPVPLAGPVYFVSHGGAKFPDAVIVLQGDGVTIKLVGETFINNKTGITSATFANTPDVPFENIEVNVPSGPFSEFGANLPAKAHYNFCGQKLVMPTFFKAQNGLEIHQNINVGVTGCPKAHRKAKRAHRARHKRKHSRQ